MAIKNIQIKLTFLFILFLYCFSANIYAKTDHRVLFIASYHPGFPTFFEQIKGLKEVFAGKNIDLDVEFMDSKRFQERENWDQFTKRLSYKMSNALPYNLIILADDNALLLALEQQEKLFKNIPIVFLGVNNVDRALEQNKNPQITGVVEAVSIKETIDLMILQQLNINKIIAIVDATPSGQGDLTTFFTFSRLYPDHKFEKIDLSNLSWSEFETELKKIDNTSSVLLLSAYKDRTGKVLLFNESLAKIKSSLEIPIYHLWEHGIGDGIIGGKVISHYNQGKEAAQIALNVLSGVDISEINVVEKSPNQYLFDFNEIQKFHIPLNRIPEKSVILNKPYSFYNEYRKEIIITIVVFTLLAIALVIAIMNILVRRRAEKQLWESKERFRSLTSNLPTAMIYQLEMAPDGTRRFLYVSENVIDINKVSSEAILNDANILYSQIVPENQKDIIALEEKALSEMSKFEFDTEMILPNGEKRWFHLTSIPHKQENGSVIWDGVEIDMTKEYKLREELNQSRKMEAIGTLAGGIAHDFNNILGAIIGFAEIALDEVNENSKIAIFLNNIIKASSRATELVKQILTYARKTEPKKVPVEVASILHEVLKLIRATMPSTIDIKEKIDCNSKVFTTPENFHQIILNLCTNAKLAMPEGGILDINLETFDVDEDYAKYHKSLSPGPHVLLSVSDSGVGIPKDIMDRLFDPFFTTREVGKGTGMGLSVVLGIVKEIGGDISVYSELGKGSTFKVILPVTGDNSYIDDNSEIADIPTGYEKILFIDDEELLVNVGQMILEDLGYSVTAFTDSVKALDYFKLNPNYFDLVISDTTMPFLSGDELALKIKEINPDLPFILCSGFSERINLEKAKSIGASDFLLKPIVKKTLANVVRKALDNKHIKNA